MDVNNVVVKLCQAGAQAELAGRIADACAYYQQAWNAAADDYEACIAAHYRARWQADAQETLRWNQIALERATRTNDGRVEPFYGSLYLNLGHSYELLGDQVAAQRYYQLAAELGYVHQAR